MSLWNNKDRYTVLDEVDEFSAYSPSTPFTQWLGGVGLALYLAGWGVHGLSTGYAKMLGRGGNLQLNGDGATALSCAYLALGAFLHFHWFWGSRPALQRYSQWLKVVALLVFVPCFGYALYSVARTWV
jgi:hypothetical protein